MKQIDCLNSTIELLLEREVEESLFLYPLSSYPRFDDLEDGEDYYYPEEREL
jgi:hypothetical protein